MPKTSKVVGYHLVVEADDPWFWSQSKNHEDEMRSIHEDLAKEIRRHCDGLRSVVVAPDAEDVCSYCGAAWTEDSDQFNGGCCDKDMEHAPPEEDE